MMMDAMDRPSCVSHGKTGFNTNFGNVPGNRDGKLSRTVNKRGRLVLITMVMSLELYTRASPVLNIIIIQNW